MNNASVNENPTVDFSANEIRPTVVESMVNGVKSFAPAVNIDGNIIEFVYISPSDSKSSAIRDSEKAVAKVIFGNLEKVAMNDGRTSGPFLHFPAGTKCSAITTWVEYEFNISGSNEAA